MTCATVDAGIRYTLDDTEPTMSSQVYADELCIDQSCTIKARAFFGDNAGPIVTERFVFVAANVTANPPAGTYPPPLTIDWKVLEPTDRSDPVDHELKALGEPSDDWRLVAASVRGKLHAHRALWRDDSFAFGRQDQWYILVVGDGAGSCRLSRVGSRIACTIMRDHLTKLLAGFQIPVKTVDTTVPDESDLLRLKAFLVEGVRVAQGALRREAAERRISIDDLSTTLLAAVQTIWNGRSLVACIQVGDGAIALWSESTGLTLMGVPDSGEFAGQTRFLTTPGIENDFYSRVLFTVKENVKAVAAMTDGVADDYFPAQEKLPKLFSEMFDQVVNAEHPDAALMQWIKYEKKGSSDDRTLVLLFKDCPNSGTSPPSAEASTDTWLGKIMTRFFSRK